MSSAGAVCAPVPPSIRLSVCQAAAAELDTERTGTGAEQEPEASSPQGSSSSEAQTVSGTSFSSTVSRCLLAAQLMRTRQQPHWLRLLGS